jgi:glycerophosphoryl diester phosphodiesterase
MKYLFLLIFATNMAVAQKTVFDLQGHRGCRGLLPENTIPAFLKALDLGVNTLEMDVVISRDGQVVVSHEPYFNPDITIDPMGKQLSKESKTNLYLMDYSEIKKYDCGAIGNLNFLEQQKLNAHKPLLTEVFRAVAKYCKKNNIPIPNYNIEIKSEEKEYDITQPKPAPFSDLVYAVISKNIPFDKITLQSFDFNVLKHWHKQMQLKKYKKTKLAALVANMKGIESNLQDLGFSPAIYSPYFKLIDNKKVELLHSKNIIVIPWTVNEVSDIKAVIGFGVDGLISDYPNRVKGLF